MAEWPQYDEAKTVDAEIEVAVQVNGKLKGTVKIPAECDKDTALGIAKANEKIAGVLAGFTVKKEIFVPGKIISFVGQPKA